MVCWEWFEHNIEFDQETAQAMEKYMNSNLRHVMLTELTAMSDVDVAHAFHAGVVAKLFTTADVRQLIEQLDVVFTDRPRTGVFWNMYKFLTKKLHLRQDLAHCMAFAFEVPPARLLQLTNHEISEGLDAIFLEDWLTISDVTLLFRKLDRYCPHRLQRSQACTISSRANPYVL